MRTKARMKYCSAHEGATIDTIQKAVLLKIENVYIEASIALEPEVTAKDINDGWQIFTAKASFWRTIFAGFGGFL